MAEIATISNYVEIVIFAGLGVGIVIFLIIGVLFSNRIIQLKKFTSKIGNGDLDAKIKIKSKDEIGALAASLKASSDHPF